MSLTLSAPSFKAYGPIDARYTCEGEDISPALSWSGVPETTCRLRERIPLAMWTRGCSH
jgi:phosphatidylethanolamine-binding protein (PEBP) family uncharacterized protein